MKHLSRWIFIKPVISIIFVGLVAGCAVQPQLFHGQLSLLDKGLTEGQVQNRVTIPPATRTRVEADRRAFMFQMYRLNNGVQTDPYVLCFEDGKLTYWGYISEFRRHPDRVLNEALNGALPDLSINNRGSR